METAQPPPPLSQGLDLFPLPTPRYLKVWIHHWLTHKNGDFGPISVTEGKLLFTDLEYVHCHTLAQCGQVFGP